jgi:hypothetical protein
MLKRAYVVECVDLERSAEVVGVCSYSRLKDSVVEVTLACVKPEAQKSGLGGHLLQEMESLSLCEWQFVQAGLSAATFFGKQGYSRISKAHQPTQQPGFQPSQVSSYPCVPDFLREHLCGEVCNVVLMHKAPPASQYRAAHPLCFPCRVQWHELVSHAAWAQAWAVGASQCYSVKGPASKVTVGGSPLHSSTL